MAFVVKDIDVLRDDVSAPEWWGKREHRDTRFLRARTAARKMTVEQRAEHLSMIDQKKARGNPLAPQEELVYDAIRYLNHYEGSSFMQHMFDARGGLKGRKFRNRLELEELLVDPAFVRAIGMKEDEKELLQAKATQQAATLGLKRYLTPEEEKALTYKKKIDERPWEWKDYLIAGGVVFSEGYKLYENEEARKEGRRIPYPDAGIEFVDGKPVPRGMMYPALGQGPYGQGAVPGPGYYQSVAGVLDAMTKGAIAMDQMFEEARKIADRYQLTLDQVLNDLKQGEAPVGPRGSGISGAGPVFASDPGVAELDVKPPMPTPDFLLPPPMIKSTQGVPVEPVGPWEPPSKAMPPAPPVRKAVVIKKGKTKKEMPASAVGGTGKAVTNPWLAHVRATWDEQKKSNPKARYNDAIKAASASWKQRNSS